MSNPSRNGNATASYRPDVDGLRAVAVLAVVLFHAFPTLLPGGFIGVDIFFVISGYLISKIIHSDLENSKFSIARFYSRRIRRIFPALIVVLIATILAGWMILLPNEFRKLGKHLIGCSGFISNLVLWKESGYFDVASESKPLLHLWSLAVEEQFYFLWPLLMALIWRLGWNFKIFSSVLIAASFAVNLVAVGTDPGAAYFLPFPRFWELLAGAMLAHLHHTDRLATPRLIHLASSLGIGMLGLGFFLIDSTSPFPGWWAILPTLGSFLLLWSGGTGWWNAKLLSSRPFVWVGLISYPLYLWHWPIFSFLRINAGDEPSIPLRIAAIALSFALAYLTYRFVEGPIRHNPSRKIIPSLLLGFALLAITGVALFFRVVPPRLNSPDLRKILEASLEWTFPGKLVPKEGAQGVHVLPTQRKGTTLFIGDSHIEHYTGRIGSTALQNPDRANSVQVVTRGGCPPIPGVHQDADPGCHDAVNRMFASAKQPEIEVVVIGACWNCYFEDILAGREPYGKFRIDSKGGQHSMSTEVGWNLALSNIQTQIESLKSTKTVFLLLDNPRGPELDPNTRIGGERLGSFQIRPALDSVPVDPVELRIRADLVAMASRAGVSTLDPRPILCSDSKCLASTQDGTPIYRDDHHLRAFFVENRATFIDSPLLLGR